MTFKKKFSEFLRDEAGQSTTEYILILAVVVMIAMRFKSSFQSVMGNATGKLESQLNGAFE